MNKIIIKDSYAELIITSPKYGEFKSKIDIEDIDRVNSRKWSIIKSRKSFYIYSSSRKLPNMRLNRFLLNYEGDLVVDHINRDTLDNRKSNLRVCTISENNKNRSGYGNCKYKYMRFLPTDKTHKVVRYDIAFPNMKRKYISNRNAAYAYYLECLMECEGGL